MCLLGQAVYLHNLQTLSVCTICSVAMQTLLGEGAKVVLEGQRVLPARAQEQGFDFKYDQVDLAVKEIVGT